jgi:UDP-N-acetylmuramoylalanine--D-glutamate ligase
MKVAIVGFGIEGAAALRYWQGRGDDVTVLDGDTHKPVPAGVKCVLGPGYLKGLDEYELVVRSPGVKPWLLNTVAAVTSGMRVFFEHCPAPIIGITGTKGKGTTATLVAKILEAGGQRVWLGGNIGVPVLDLLPKVEAEDMVVVEMSSFQLIDMEQSPGIAVCLLIVPEHQDWHQDMDEYVGAKGNIFAQQRAGDLAVYDARNEFAVKLARLSAGRQVPYLKAPGAEVEGGKIIIGGVEICEVSEVGLLGPHNLENVCAAITATWDLVGADPAPVRQVVKSFRGLPHRLELVREVDGVRYINDSFAANPVAAIAALRSFDEPKVLILGGLDRGLDMSALAAAVAGSKVRQVVLVGESAQRIGECLQQAGFEDCNIVRGEMDLIVDKARSAARPGDVVLLSPGCPSFDSFKNFEDRGEQFKAAVAGLGVRA